MEMIPVQSSNVAAIGFDAGTLGVQFKDGSRYEYPDVTAERFAEFQAAESKGRWLQEFVASRKGVKKESDTSSALRVYSNQKANPIHTSQAEGCCHKQINNAALSGKLDVLIREKKNFECPVCGSEYSPVSKPEFGPLINWEYVCDVLVVRRR